MKITLGCLRNFSSGLPPLCLKALLTGSKVQLEFSLPFAFDNIYAQDDFYRAIHTETAGYLNMDARKTNLGQWEHSTFGCDVQVEGVKKLEN